MSSEPEETPEQKFPFKVALDRLNWVASALSKDDHRRVLLYAALIEMPDGIYLAATDTHRVHAVHVGEGVLEDARRVTKEIAIGKDLIDLRRLIWEMRFVKAKSLRFNLDGEYEVTKAELHDRKWEVVGMYTPMFAGSVGVYPNLHSVIPEVTKAPCGFAMLPKYITDACKLATNGVLLLGDGWSRPVKFVPNADKGAMKEWFAIVMPRGLGFDPKTMDWVEDAK